MFNELLLRRKRMFNSYKLIGSFRSGLNTEMRFLFAGARVDGEELVRLELPHGDDEKENSRISGSVIKVLRTLKKDGVIQFYVNREGFAAASTEASFLLNKYGEFISDGVSEPAYIYVKL